MEYGLVINLNANRVLDEHERQRVGAAVEEFVRNLLDARVVRAGVQFGPRREARQIQVGDGAVVRMEDVSAGNGSPVIGYLVIEADTLETACDIAAACPAAAVGAVEVWPVGRRLEPDR